MHEGQKRRIYNPCEFRITLDKKENQDGTPYYIGRSDMDLSMFESIIKFYPGGDDKGTLVINRDKSYYKD